MNDQINRVELLMICIILTKSLNSCTSGISRMDIEMDYDKKKQTINYERVGSGENKILFIHGFGASRKSFYDIIPFFDETFELYLIDLVGFGDSKPNLNFEFTPQNQAKAVYDFIQEKKLENLIIIGHSYGGGVALILLQLTEMNKKNFISNMILLDPAAYPQEFPFFISILRIPIVSKILLDIASEHFQAKFILEHLFWDDSKVTPERIERYAEYYEKNYNKYAILETAKKIIPLNFGEIQKNIKRSTTPTLIIWGNRDPVIPKGNVLRLNKELSNSQLVILEEVGHVVHEEKPKEVFFEIMRFLEHKDR